MLDTTKEPWPADYKSKLIWRQRSRLKIRKLVDTAPFEEREIVRQAWKKFYSTRALVFITHWGVVVEPRDAGGHALTTLPFIPFKRQQDLIQFITELLRDRESGLVEKSRDMGATWTCVWISVWLWLFWGGAQIGWGSRSARLVDIIGNPDSIMEKVRIAIRNVPKFLRPTGFSLRDHMPIMRVINPETGATITGDIGDNIGRGGRSLIYFKDESAHYEHPEMVEAALSENAAIQLDISSVHGIGTVFHRRREAGVDWYPGAEMEKGRTRVFVMDWRDHPGKSQEWYDVKKKKATEEGLLHIFAQEIDRDYSASVEGVIIKSEWIQASIDAHIRLGLKDDGLWGAGLDVADEDDGSNDRNAIVLRKGIVCKEAGEWGARDPGVTTRNVVAAVQDILPLELQYDCIGIGVAVKSEYNRLVETKACPKTLRLVPWNAGAAPLWPDKRVNPGDKKSPLNEDFFHNLKAQAWWHAARRFQNTWRIFNDPEYAKGGWTAEDLISLDSKSIGGVLPKLVKELSQPTMTKSTKLKLLVDKMPEGAKSPNLGDSFVMAYFPAEERKPFKISSGVLQRSRIPNISPLNRALSRRR